MALKDLTTSSAALTEQQIEELVSPFVRFDPDAGLVVFLPTARALSNRQRVLLYLTALQGWPFVTEKHHETPAALSIISNALHIPGGTLRPIVKELKDRNIISQVGRAYSIRTNALGAIREAMQSTNRATPSESTEKGKRRGRGSHAAVDFKSPARSKRGIPGRRHGRRRHGGEGAVFLEWIAQGFFRQPKTFSDVFEQFHSTGRLIKKTSLPGYLLGGVRSGILTRVKKDVDGKRVWVYQARERSK